MRKLRIGLLAIPIVVFVITGCETSPTISGPSNIRGVKEFALEPVNFEKAVVDGVSEDEFKASKNPDQIHNWEGDKVAIKERFAASLKQTLARNGLSLLEQAGGQHYTIHPVVTVLENGYYRLPAWTAVTHIYMRITVVDSDGKTVDQTSVHGSQSFDALIAPAVGGRLRNVAEEIGDKYGRYLKKRTDG